MRRHSAVVVAVTLLGSLTVAQCGGAANPVAPTPPPSSSAPTVSTISTDLPMAAASTTAGVYQDGNGTYPAGDDSYFSGDGQSIFVRPLCPTSSRGTPRRLNLVLPSSAREVASGRLSTCMDLEGNGRAEGVFLHVPSPVRVQPGGIVGSAAPANFDTSVSVFLLFNVDSNGDGTIRVSPDDQYNVRWQRGLYLQRRSETSMATIYTLTSRATEFGSDLSCHAELILRNTPLGEVSKGTHCLPLEVTFTVHK